MNPPVALNPTHTFLVQMYQERRAAGDFASARQIKESAKQTAINQGNLSLSPWPVTQLVNVLNEVPQMTFALDDKSIRMLERTNRALRDSCQNSFLWEAQFRRIFELAPGIVGRLHAVRSIPNRALGFKSYVKVTWLI